MKWAIGAVCTAALFLSGCDTVRNDLSHSGGAVGYYADSIIPGETKELQLYRAAFAFAFLSRLGAVTLQDRTEARAFLFRMQAVSTDLNRLGGHLQAGVVDCNALAAANTDCRQLFESDLPQLEGHLFRLAVASVPRDQLDDIWDELKSGNYIAMAWNLAKVGGQEIAAAHSGAAVWRSEREIFAEVISAVAPDCENAETVDAATKCIDSYAASGADRFAAVKPGSGPIYAFYDIVQDSCMRLKTLANSKPTGSEAAETTQLNCAFSYGPKANTYSDADATTATAPVGVAGAAAHMPAAVAKAARPNGLNLGAVP